MPTYFEKDYGDCCKVFADSYELSNLPAMLDIERAVLGCDYGGTSWTTREQAADIVDMLGLVAGTHVLDIGAGSGWPGLFLAQTSGCQLTLLDLPKNALAMARRRARTEGIADRVNAVAASGHALPFANASFLAITHSDVLCCLPEKTRMLEECSRIAGDGAQMLFSVIAVAPGLTGEQRQVALDVGPPFVDAPADYDDLLAQCGWRILHQADCSAEHRESLQKLVAALESSTALAAELGPEAIHAAATHRRQQIEAIDGGLLDRTTYLVAAS